MSLKYKRVLIKLSGEAFLGKKSFGFDEKALLQISNIIKDLHGQGLQIAVVVGGGNLFRGSESNLDLSRSSADQIGMLATVMNGIALKEALEKALLSCEHFSSFGPHPFAQLYSRTKALQCLEKNHVLIFSGGIANPYFTTDSAAALRASEIDADILIKATQVDGIYNKDPHLYADAIKFERMTHIQVIEKRLKIMDLTAVDICRQSKIPILVLALNDLKQEALMQDTGTLVASGEW